MISKAPSGYVLVPDDRLDLLQTPGGDKLVRYMQRGKLALLPLAFLTWLVIGTATGNFGLVLVIVVPASLFLVSVAEFACRTADLAVSRIFLPHRLRIHDRAGLLILVPKGLVKLADQGTKGSSRTLLDHNHEATRQLVQLYRQQGNSTEVKATIAALAKPAD
jgi:hypothetical protein